MKNLKKCYAIFILFDIHLKAHSQWNTVALKPHNLGKYIMLAHHIVLYMLAIVKEQMHPISKYDTLVVH